MDQKTQRPSPHPGIRRTHKKSRTGCKTCRTRHIRCDETYPRCRNCKRGNRLCSYNIPSPEIQNSPPGQGRWILHPHLDAQFFRPVEIRLLHHLINHDSETRFISSDNIYSLWLRKLPGMVPEHRFVLDSLLGVSAAHLNLVGESAETQQLALHYRSQAMNGLQLAVSNFTKENADAVVACSILLTWFQCDWNEWASLMRGLKSLIISMHPYKEQSSFIDIIDEEEILPEEMQPLPPTSTESKMPTAQDIEALDELYSKLLEVREFVNGHEEEENLVDQILGFVRMLQAKVPIISPDEQFLATKVLRTAMAATPASFIRRMRREPQAMMAAAFFFVTVLVSQPLFPAMGTMFFARNAFSPINEISNYLNERRSHPVASRAHDWTKPTEFMAYAQETVRRFRAKLGWPTVL